MRRQMVVLLAGSAIACAGEPTAPEPFAPTDGAAAVGAGSWAARAQYPVDIFDVTSASITNHSGTRMYVIGGFQKCCGAGQITDAVKAYDATTGTWTAKARYPVRVRATNGAAELGGRIYVTGGFTRRQTEPGGPWRLETLKSLYVYTPGSNTWVRKRDMSLTSVNGASVAYRGMLYVATPCYDTSVCPSLGSVVWRYNPATDQWARFGERPTRDWWNVAAGVIGGKLYLVEEYGGAMDILDLTTGAWTSGPSRPYRACDMASTAFQAKLYLFGYCDDYPTDPVTRDRGLVFDPATSSWSEVAAAPVRTGSDAALARVFVNGQPRLSLVQGTRPNNHYQFVP